MRLDAGATVSLEETLNTLRSQGLTFCGRPGKLETLIAVVQRIEQQKIPGIFIEAGVAMGGSAIVTAKAKAPERRLQLYDVFEMLPPPSEKDDPQAKATYQSFVDGRVTGLTNQNYVQHAENLLAYIISNMENFGIDPNEQNITFHKGLFQSTLQIVEPVAFAHIDCDWYDSVVTCIERMAPNMSLGGIMLFDDYNSFAGCRKAVDEWLSHDHRFKVIHKDWTIAVKRSA